MAFMARINETGFGMDLNTNETSMSKETIRKFYNSTAGSRQKWKKRNSFYHASLQKYYSFIIPEGRRVLELGCGLGDLLHAVKPAYGVGVDFSEVIITGAKAKYPDLVFHTVDVEELELDEQFDYIILSDLVGCLWDIQKALHNIRSLCHAQTRIVISNYNFLWEPVMALGEMLRIKLPQPKQNWLSRADITTLLYQEGFEVIAVQKKLLLPKYVPLLNAILNSFMANLPVVDNLDLVNILVARPIPGKEEDLSVSVIIPARNERGNIENAIKRLPSFGRSLEVVFVEGHSSDQTLEEMERVRDAYPDKKIKVIRQTGKGKGNAVREGFDVAGGDVLMILDADLTVPPEELPKFYEALKGGKGEFINGCRLVYPMEKQAMRFLNFIANKFFGWFFTYLLGQRLKDTLCGTKVLLARDYRAIRENRKFFGDFDPFGDFDLLFGASKLNLKITEIIIRYRDREYGSTQISRFSHGWLLVKMSFFAARKMKFR
jgi:ubiquinone/menaquinone biosynthesis C-methylase UbiE